jgi:hypothetical protein
MSRLRLHSSRAQRRRQQSLQAGTLFLILATFVLVLVLVSLGNKQSEALEAPPHPSPDPVGASAPGTAPASPGGTEPTAR